MNDFEIDFNNLPSNIKKIYFDVGLSYYAPYSQDWLKKVENSLVIGFEPNPINIKFLKNGKTEKIQDLEKLEKEFIDSKRFQLMECAVSDVKENTISDFFNFEDKGEGQNCSSLYKFKDEYCKKYNNKIKKIKVPVYPLSYFLNQIPFERFPYISYIKVDTQGADLDVLKSCGKILSERVVYVTAENDGNFYEGAKNIIDKDMIEFMIQNNFILVNHDNTRDLTFLNKKYIHLQNEYILQKY